MVISSLLKSLVFIYLFFFAYLPSLGVLACLDGYMNIALEQTEEYANGQVRITVRDQLDDSKKVVFQGCCYIFSYWHITLCREISTQPIH